MKPKLKGAKWWLLLLSPLFIRGMCTKENEEVAPPAADEYVTWKLGSAGGSLQVPTDSLTLVLWTNKTAIYGMTKPVPATNFYIAFEGPHQSGTYSAREFRVYSGGKYYVPASTPLLVGISAYGSSGQYVMGTYSGNVRDSSTSAQVAVSGEFRIRRR